ncbi:hypothetical protein LshimejAT787_0408500 [Lyophyllum shimeji]|uniref:Uncharacterized protein n=1 Tax=Lyophyllum shimeji TaxID=47721 RepID=A0A9P3PLU1_LYOSH|nr:hypothetical protein LshimejAT787_0408500 [Lyophyllum shimeji]
MRTYVLHCLPLIVLPPEGHHGGVAIVNCAIAGQRIEVEISKCHGRGRGRGGGRGCGRYRRAENATGAGVGTGVGTGADVGVGAGVDVGVGRGAGVDVGVGRGAGMGVGVGRGAGVDVGVGAGALAQEGETRCLLRAGHIHLPDQPKAAGGQALRGKGAAAAERGGRGKLQSPMPNSNRDHMAPAQVEVQARLMRLAAADPEALHALGHSEKDEFCSRLRELATASGTKCTLAAKAEGHGGTARLQELGLDWKKVDWDAYLQKIPSATVTALRVPYPPMKECIAESSAIFHKWYDHFATGPQADSRKRRLPVHRLDHSKLVRDVLPEESVIFRNRRGRLVAAVLRNFCPDEATVAWADSVVADTMPGRRNIRMEDPGKLVQMGYSAGARSKPAFHWVRNLLSKAGGPAAAAESDCKASCVYALAWQLLRGHLPEEVICDFDDFMEKTALRRMDGNGRMSSGGAAGTYSVTANGHEFHFHDAELAPPAGVFGENYARAPHTEGQPHKYGVSWTLTRTGGAEWGGHFYLAKYGIRVQGAPNTVVVWLPGEAHGTSLQDIHPDDCNPPFCQRGLAFVTSNRLVGVWEKYLAGQVSMKDVEEALLEDDVD